jgi:hypothetical protein
LERGSLAGLQRAKRAGRALGRRAVKVDLARAERLRTDGLGLRAIAAKLGISVNTLQKARGKGWGVRLHQPHSRPLPSASIVRLTFGRVDLLLPINSSHPLAQ